MIRRILRGAGIRSSYGAMGAGSVTLVEDQGKRILIDVGHYGNRDQLRVAISGAGLKTENVDYVVLTHVHWDHCLNVDLFNRSEILVHEKEFNMGTLSGVKDLPTESFKAFLKSMNLRLISKDGYELTRNVRTIDTFGHAPGHMSVVVEDPGGTVVVSGDALPNLRALRRGLPDFIFYDEVMARRSIERIRKMRPHTIFPGHDSPFNEEGYIETDEVDIRLRETGENDLIVRIVRTLAEKPIKPA